MYVLPIRPFLQVNITIRVEYMQMHDWVQQLRAAMTLASRGRANYLSAFVNYWK